MRNYNPILIIISIVSVAIVAGFIEDDYKQKHTPWHTNNYKIIEAAYTEQEVVDELYQLLKDTDEILTKNNITYWHHDGTTLGAIRHGGLIPWDNDIDLVIPKGQVGKLDNLRTEFTKLGYELKKDRFWYRVYGPQRKLISNQLPFRVGLDIFIMEEKDGIYNYSHLYVRWLFPNEYYYAKDIFPLKRHKFGPITIWGPANPIAHLDTNYKDWRHIIIIDPHHNGLPINRPISFDIKGQEIKPALPSKKLQDRVF